MSRARLPLLFVLVVAVSGCGLYVPNTHEFYEDTLDEIANENDLINQVKCEIHRAVDPKTNGNSVAWLGNWAAKVSFVLTVDEKGGLSPGFSLSEPFSLPNKGQLFSLSGGVNGSSDITRKETVGFTFSIPKLLQEGSIEQKCSNENGILTHSDLKIADFVKVKSNLAKIPGTIAGPYTAFTYQTTFVIAYGGNITPTWKLVRFTANPGGSFFTTSRSKTNDLVITFAELTPPPAPGAPPQMSQTGQEQHSAALIGNAIASSIVSTTQP
jgi:hypothetical protein